MTIRNLFTNQKETNRAIEAAEDQFRMVLKKKHECVICGCTPKPYLKGMNGPHKLRTQGFALIVVNRYEKAGPQNNT